MEGCEKKQNKMESFDPDFVIPLIGLHSVSSVCAILLNALVILTIWKTPSLRTPSRVLMCSLVISDLCMGLIAQPLFIVYCVAALRKWSGVFCSIWAVNLRVGYCLGGLSFGSLTFMSLDRYLAIKTKASYKSLVTLKRVLLLVIGGWILCIACISLAIQYLPFRTCLLVGAICVSIGLLIITVSYSLSFIALKKLSQVPCPTATLSTSKNYRFLTNQSASLNQRKTIDQSLPIERTASVIQLESGCHENQSTSVYQEYQLPSAHEGNQSAMAHQGDQSASAHEENQSASAHQGNQSASAHQGNQSASAHQESQSTSAHHGNQSRTVNQENKPSSSSPPLSTAFNVSRYKRSLMTVVMILALTFLSYFPLIIHTSISAFFGLNNISFSHYSQFIFALNSAINPLFYLWRMKDLRKATRATLRAIVSRL